MKPSKAHKHYGRWLPQATGMLAFAGLAGINPVDETNPCDSDEPCLLFEKIGENCNVWFKEF